VAVVAAVLQQREPAYTAGGSNTVYFSGGPCTPFSQYQVRRVSNAACTSNVADSPWSANTSYTFNNLADGVQYYYCTRGEYTADSTLSAWSSSTASTQDATAPTPQLTALPAYQPGTAIAVS
jgi:hypothetical protein